MKIGIPTKIKAQENRVALTQGGVDTGWRGGTARAGHSELVQQGCGLATGLRLRTIPIPVPPCANCCGVFTQTEMIVKVKEPLAPDP